MFKALVSTAALCVLLGGTCPLQASERRFTYVYEATTLPKGSVEIENWATWKNKDSGDQFDFRHEVEFGLTDHIQLALYVADWSHYENKHDGHSNEYKSSAVELIGNLTNPVTDFLGSALYGEVKFGPDLFVLEGKLLLQKNVGPLVVAYNVGIEAEWEGEHLDEYLGEFKQTLGVSYQVAPWLTVGAEALHELEMPEWNAGIEDPVVYAGPNVSLRYKDLFATVTPLFQVTDVEGEPDVQTRVIVGFHF